METEHIKMEQISGDESETRDLKIGLSTLINQDELDMQTMIDIGEVKTETHKDDYVELSDMPPDDQQLIGVEDMIDIGEVKIESHTEEDMESFQLSEVSSDKPVALDDKDEYVEYKCNLCPKAYRTKQNLRHHIKLIHEPKPFECLVCQVKFLYEIQLKKHKRSQEHLDKLPKTLTQAPTKTAVKEKKVHYCSICEQSFATNYALQMHSERHQPGQCDVCQKTFQDRRKLSLHMKHHGAKRFKCSEAYCGKSFVCKRSFRVHLRMHETKRKREALTFNCEMCAYTFAQKYKLTAHKKRVHGIKSQVSTRQDTNYLDDLKLSHENQNKALMDVQQQPLQEHVKVKTEPLDEDDFTLTFAEEAESFSENTYSGSSDLHLQSVSQNDLLNNHQIESEQSADLEDTIDIGEVKIEPSEDDYIEGANVLPGTKTLSKVSKTDNENANGSERNSVETGNIAKPPARRKCKPGKPKPEKIDDGKPRPYKCNLCQLSFRLNSRLKKHFVNKHAPKIFECDLCDASFRRPYELIIHKRAHEKEKEEGFYSVQAQLNAKIANLNEEPVGKDTNNDSAVPLQTQQNSSGSALQCAKCFSFWPTQKRLWLHHNAAHREKIQCTLCSETFNYEKRLENHKLAYHKQKDGSFQPLKCSECDKTFDTTLRLKRHKDVHAPMIHNCTSCSQSFRNRFTLQQHERTHIFDGVVMECELCNKTFASHKLKRLHMRAHAPKQYRCHLCNKDCLFRANLLVHMQSHEKEHWTLVENPTLSSLRKLAENSKASTSEDNSSRLNAKKEELEISTNDVAKNVNSIANCPSEAGKREAMHTSELTKKKKRKSLPDKSKPKDCHSKLESPSVDLPSTNGQPYVGKSNEMHGENEKGAVKSADIGEMKIGTLPDDEGVLLEDTPNLRETNVKDPAIDSSAIQEMILAVKCNTCGKVLPNRRQWWQHNRKVHGPKNFICPICGRPFVDRPALQRHIPTHDSIHERRQAKPAVDKANVERPFQCDICQKSYPVKCTLTKHKKLVHGPKVHACDICESAFTRRALLEKHMRLHKNDQSGLQCEICYKTFPTIHRRSQHMKTHAVKKHQCPFCSKTCSRRNNLYLHMKKHDEFHDTALPSSSVTAGLESDEQSETSTNGNPSSK